MGTTPQGQQGLSKPLIHHLIPFILQKSRALCLTRCPQAPWEVVYSPFSSWHYFTRESLGSNYIVKNMMDTQEMLNQLIVGGKSDTSITSINLSDQTRERWGLFHGACSLEKTLMLGNIEGRRRRGQWRTRWLDGITDSMDMSLSNLWEMVKDRRPGALQSMGLQRVRHDWAAEQQFHGGGFPGGISSKGTACQCRRCKRLEFDPWVGKIPLEEGMATHSSILAWRIP